VKSLTPRQSEVMGLLDGSEWRALARPDAIVAGHLCQPFRPEGPRYVERQTTPSLVNPGGLVQVYRLTRDGVARLKYEEERHVSHR